MIAVRRSPGRRSQRAPLRMPRASLALAALGLSLLVDPAASWSQGGLPFADGFESGDLSAWAPTCGDDGRLCPILCGDGVIDDVRTGGTVALEHRSMVHVVLLAEGYTAGDLASGAFDEDVVDWLVEWQAIDPYSTFANAFCVWQWSVPSNEHVTFTSPQAADTALRVPITSDGSGIDSTVPATGPTAQRVWDLLYDFQYRPSSFYPFGGHTSRAAKNVIPVILVLDPSTGHSGFSGRTRALQNPADSSQAVFAAIAHNRPHEFTHAFSRLADEYIETSGGPLCTSNALAVDSPWVTNVVCSPQCGTLPWEHLREGTAINPSTDDLVGAFGAAVVGYHPELKCLMNGTHDNAIVYGGDGDLRVRDRMCNFCRELTVFRLFERIHVLDDPTVSYSVWVDTYRTPYFARFGFAVPDPVPQQNSSGESFFDDCTFSSFGVTHSWPAAEPPGSSCGDDELPIVPFVGLHRGER